MKDGNEIKENVIIRPMEKIINRLGSSKISEFPITNISPTGIIRKLVITIDEGNGIVIFKQRGEYGSRYPMISLKFGFEDIKSIRIRYPNYITINCHNMIKSITGEENLSLFNDIWQIICELDNNSEMKSIIACFDKINPLFINIVNFQDKETEMEPEEKLFECECKVNYNISEKYEKLMRTVSYDGILVLTESSIIIKKAKVVKEKPHFDSFYVDLSTILYSVIRYSYDGVRYSYEINVTLKDTRTFTLKINEISDMFIKKLRICNTKFFEFTEHVSPGPDLVNNNMSSFEVSSFLDKSLNVIKGIPEQKLKYYEHNEMDTSPTLALSKEDLDDKIEVKRLKIKCDGYSRKNIERPNDRISILHELTRNDQSLRDITKGYYDNNDNDSLNNDSFDNVRFSQQQKEQGQGQEDEENTKFLCSSPLAKSGSNYFKNGSTFLFDDNSYDVTVSEESMEMECRKAKIGGNDIIKRLYPIKTPTKFLTMKNLSTKHVDVPKSQELQKLLSETKNDFFCPFIPPLMNKSRRFSTKGNNKRSSQAGKSPSPNNNNNNNNIESRANNVNQNLRIKDFNVEAKDGVLHNHGRPGDLLLDMDESNREVKTNTKNYTGEYNLLPLRKLSEYNESISNRKQEIGQDEYRQFMKWSGTDEERNREISLNDYLHPPRTNTQQLDGHFGHVETSATQGDQENGEIDQLRNRYPTMETRDVASGHVDEDDGQKSGLSGLVEGCNDEGSFKEFSSSAIDSFDEFERQMKEIYGITKKPE